MPNGPLSLLARRRFLPLLLSLLLGAANDNFFKTALIVLVVYRLEIPDGWSPALLSTVAGGLFIAPFFLFSALAGDIADRFEKSRLLKLWKAVEIVIAAAGIAALAAGNLAAMLAVLFLLGLQSTFIGPIKYAILPEYLDETELLGGNALVEGGTFLAILAGTIGGSWAAMAAGGPVWVGALMSAQAVAGFAASLWLPPARPGNRDVTIDLGLVAANRTLWRLVRSRRELWLAVLGISWFWLVGATYLTQFPAFAKQTLTADSPVVTLLLAMFSIGIGLGSLLCGRLLKGQISARHVPWAALGMTVCAVDLYFAGGQGQAGPLRGLAAFLATPAAWRVLADLLGLSVCGGVYAVPLYTLLQTHSAAAGRARVIAANNIANAAFMVVGALLTAPLLAAGLSVPGLFLTLGLLTLGVAWGLRRL